MRIGLYNLEPDIVNSAMMRVSRWHKDNGDEVEIYIPVKKNQLRLFEKKFDKIYCFSLFDFTPKDKVPKGAICGGTGFDLTTRLPKKIEDANYDWSLYPDCDFSLIWFSEGCIRNCPYCVVRKKEGYLHRVNQKNLNPNGKYIKVQDNNFFANPEWGDFIKQLHEWNQPVVFAGGIDARIMNKEMCDALNSLKHEGQIKVAWDNPKEDILKHIKEILKYIKPYKIGCYVLIGYWSSEEDDIMRVEALRKLKIDPFVMPFKKSDPYQHAYARYVNHKAIFKSHTWEEYKKEYHVKY